MKTTARHNTGRRWPTTKSEIRRTYWPYCLQRLGDGTWVPLNREYRPLGVPPEGHWVDPESFAASQRIPDIPPAARAALDVFGDGTGPKIYLYDDGCIPTASKRNMRKYEKKLEILDAQMARNAGVH